MINKFYFEWIQGNKFYKRNRQQEKKIIRLVAEVEWTTKYIFYRTKLEHKICVTILCNTKPKKKKKKKTTENNSYLVGDGGGYDMPLWLGDNKFVCPVAVPIPGTSNVLFDMCVEFKFKFGKLWPKWISGCTSNVFVPRNFVGLFCGTFLFVAVNNCVPLCVAISCIPSSLDNELAFS